MTYSQQDLDIIYGALLDKLDEVEPKDKIYAGAINKVLIKTQELSEINRLDRLCEAVELANSLFEEATDGTYSILWKTKYDEVRFELESFWLVVHDSDGNLLVDNRDLFLKCVAKACIKYSDVASELLDEAMSAIY